MPILSFKKQILTLACLITIFAGLVISFITAYKLPVIPPSATQLKPVAPRIINAPNIPYHNLPIRLKIPSIAVDAPITHAGFTTAGAMDAPKSQGDVAWFSRGPRPGAIGSAVMSGHYGWVNKRGSVFNKLNTLRAGDKLYVIDEKQKTTTFVVRKSQEYTKDADALAVFSSRDGKSHLNLVTCSGTWVQSLQTYTHRLVIFADKA